MNSSSISYRTNAAGVPLRVAGVDAAKGPPHASAHWFTSEVAPHEPALRRYLGSKFSSLLDVDDIIQETYTRLLKFQAKGDINLSRGYLFVVARNIALDWLRHRNALQLVNIPEDPIVDDKPMISESMCRDQELQLLEEAILTLPARCADILRLARIEGLSYKEIARALGIKESTVNAQLAIGLMKCRQYLCAHGVEKACIQIKNALQQH